MSNNLLGQSTEIANLIKIKEYLSSCVGSFTLDKYTIAELRKLSEDVDRKIIKLIQTEQFKKYLNY